MNLDRIEVADCRVWLANLPEHSIDLFMTSPPYWNQHRPRSTPSTLESIWDMSVRCQHEWASDGSCANCGGWKGELGLEPTREMYVAHLMEVFGLIRKVLKATGSFYLNLGGTLGPTLGRHTGDRGGIPHRIERGMHDSGWILVDKSTWQKLLLPSSGQVSSRKSSYELLFHFVRSTKTLLWHNAESREWVRKKPLQIYRNTKNDVETKWDKLGTRQVWKPFPYYYDLDAISELRERRTPVEVRTLQYGRIKGPLFEAFPEEFCMKPILSSCPLEGIVADPFAGSGTTLVVAKKLGRHYVGCDLNPDYVKLARKRLAVVNSPVT